jgi:hypothetical protein
MRRLILLVGLIAGAAFAVNPSLSLKANQPVAEEMQQAYHILPSASLGLQFPRSDFLTFNTELSGTSGWGTGDFSGFSVWSAALRFGAEFTPIQEWGLYLTPGIMLGYAAERNPYADTMGNIGDRSYSGGGFGLFLNGGIPLVRSRNWQIAFELGVDVLSFPTDRARVDPGWSPYYPYYYSANLSSLNIGFVFKRNQNPSGARGK